MALFRTDSLHQPISKEELATLKQRRKNGDFGPAQNLAFLNVILFVVVGVYFLFILGQMLSRTSRASLPGMAPFFLLFFALLGVAGWQVLRGFSSGGRHAWARIARFADQNGLRYRIRSSNPAYPGLIFNRGSDRRSTNHVVSETGAFADAGNYSYVTGSGKNKTTHRWRFAAFRLPRQMPHLLLDAKSNNMFGSNLPVSFSRDQRVSLGSPFDDHYTLYAPSAYAPDAFFLFPPNVMQALLDATSDYDIEIVDDWMLLYTRSEQDLTDPETWRLFETIDESVVAGLTRVSQRYTDRRVSAHQGTPGEPVRGVAESGRRLKRSAPVMTLVTFGGMFALWLLMRFVIG